MLRGTLWTILIAVSLFVGGGSASARPHDDVPAKPAVDHFAECCVAADSLLDIRPERVPLGALIDQHAMREPLARVQAAIARWCGGPAASMLTVPMRRAIDSPLGLAGTTHALAGELAVPTPLPAGSRAKSPQRLAADLVMRSFGGSPSDLAAYQGAVPVPSPQSAIYAMDFFLNEPRLKLEGALAARPTPAATLAFLQWIGEVVSPSEVPAEHRSAIEQLRRGIDTSDEGLMRAVASALAHIDADIRVEAAWESCETEPVPADIAGAVTGTVLGAEQVPGIGWVVVGGLGANTYDLSVLAAVFDPGGDDTYVWHAVKTGNQGIIDLAGNDRYQGSHDQGPACGILGLSFIDDRAGDDRYEGERFACGVGIVGAGVLIDRAGNDRYSARSWSMGVGAWGAGFLFDEAGSDSYISGEYSQGLGGPLGIGAVVDSTGDDLYRVDGIVPSNYGMPAVSYAMSQAVGFGARGLCPGGVGLLIDRSGNDRYEAGEFAQGGGYYLGFGALIDVEGSDLYRANRYSQGWSAHQASGTLIDVAGDDTYWGTIADSQGASWDTTVALLLDGSGDDTYRGAIGSQGSAAHQAIAALCDLEGSDHYTASGPFAQGESGDNTYHFAATGARSFSVLIDAGPGSDFFSMRRTTPGVTVPGPALEPTAPAGAGLFGLCIDLPIAPATATAK